MICSKQWLLAFLTLIALFCMNSACHSDPPSVDSDADGSKDLPRFFLERPWLQDRSTWSSHASDAEPKRLGMIGGFGAGNGTVFALIAGRRPYNTIHNLIGPGYQKRDRFFTDKVFSLEAGGATVHFAEDSAYRVRRTAIVITRAATAPGGAYEGLELWTVDAAPLIPGLEGDPAERSLVRHLVVRNADEPAVPDVNLVMKSTLGLTLGGSLYESDWNEKRLIVRPLGHTAVTESGRGRLTVPIGSLEPGAEAVVPFAFACACTRAGAEAVLDRIEAIGPGTILDRTRAWWDAWYVEGAAITTPDPHFDDLIDGLQVLIRCQQAATGATCVMSEYTGTWIRDTVGPVLFYSMLGRTGDLKRMLDYYWGATLLRGDIANSMAADLDISDLPVQPDWESMGPLTGRVGAETPSYIPLQYKSYYRATGDLDTLAERYGLFKHCILHQDFREGCLLPFSGDETYREIMKVAFGYWFGQILYDTHLSANSSFLFVAAAEFMAELAGRLGFVEDVALFTGLADEVRSCTEEYYWLAGEGYYAPIIDIHTLEPVCQPYEDVSLKPLWTGYAGPDDARARENLLTVMDRLGQPDGTIQSPPDPVFFPLMQILDIHEGIYTGMAPGYYLDNLARADHPMALEAFRRFADVFGDSGSVYEVHVADDHGRLALLYEPFGLICDYTSRLRPWEGGIVGAALLGYLTGFEPDAGDGRMTLAPHLPPEWDSFTADRLPIGADTFDLEVSDPGGRRKVVVANRSRSFLLDLTVSVSGSITDLTVDGIPHDPHAYPTETEWGRSRIWLEDVEITPGGRLEVEVGYAD